MFELIHESGFGGWTTLIATILGAAATVTIGRRRGRPGTVAAAWAVVVLASGALGFGTGQRNVDRAIQTVPHEKRATILSMGTREAAANCLLSGACAQLLCLLGGVLVLVSREPKQTGAAPPATRTV